MRDEMLKCHIGCHPQSLFPFVSRLNTAKPGEARCRRTLTNKNDSGLKARSSLICERDEQHFCDLRSPRPSGLINSSKLWTGMSCTHPALTALTVSPRFACVEFVWRQVQHARPRSWLISTQTNLHGPQKNTPLQCITFSCLWFPLVGWLPSIFQLSMHFAILWWYQTRCFPSKVYPYCEKWALSWTWRKHLIMKDTFTTRQAFLSSFNKLWRLLQANLKLKHSWILTSNEDTYNHVRILGSCPRALATVDSYGLPCLSVSGAEVHGRWYHHSSRGEEHKATISNQRSTKIRMLEMRKAMMMIMMMMMIIIIIIYYLLFIIYYYCCYCYYDYYYCYDYDYYYHYLWWGRLGLKMTLH